MISISKNKQSGSAHIIIISILAIALIGALGFIFWTNIVQPEAETKTSVETVVSPSPSVNRGPESDKDTIVISDWKVQFTIPDSLKDDSVKYSQQTKDGSTSYGFTTARIIALGGDCATQPYGKSVVLNRSTSSPVGMDGYVQINSSPLNGYYYTYRETIPACSGSSTDPTVKVSQVEIDDTASLGTLLKSLKASE